MHSKDNSERVRVMIVDDSALMRKLLSETLSRDPAIEVIDTAMDGQFALEHLSKVRPDVVLMDVDMPRLDGLGALDRIVADYRLPVVMCSAQTTAGAKATIEALARGAVDFIEKPMLADLTSGAATKTIGEKIHGAKRARVSARVATTPAASQLSTEAPTRPSETGSWHKTLEAIRVTARTMRPDLIAIGTSTGGPPALEQVLGSLPADFPLGIVIVQHMPPGFTQQLANHLDRMCAINVREAQERETVQPGVALIAPGNFHMRVLRGDGKYFVTLDARTPPVSGHCPSVDVLFESVARNAGSHGVGFIMTGMGSDGAEGLGKLAQAGGMTVAQTPDSCICFGMPKSAIDRGHARAVVPLEGIAPAMIACAPASGS